LQTFSVAVSALALSVSVLTAWLTLFRRGTVKMTHPTVIFFGPDSSPRNDHNPKVYLRTLLFCTSKRGRVIESMHVSLARNETRQNFNIWVYGEERLVRGSGLFVGESGISANHHFLTPPDQNHFQFREGTYRLEVFAKLLGGNAPIKLFSQELTIQSEQGLAIQKPGVGLYFDWGPDSSTYIAHIEEKPSVPIPKDMLRMLGYVDSGKPSDD
jgi:hypothetical protein